MALESEENLSAEIPARRMRFFAGRRPPVRGAKRSKLIRALNVNPGERPEYHNSDDQGFPQTIQPESRLWE